MSAGIVGVDHPVIAVRSLSQAREAYERMGFSIPPDGRHIEWGTGNLCIMLPTDYLELRGVADPQRYTHHLDKFLELREGLMGLAFATQSAERSHQEAIESGLTPSDLKQLTRRFLLPEGDTFPRFNIVSLNPVDTPGLMTSVICEHLTPALIRRDEWLDHPNGAVSVRAITSVVENPASFKSHYEALFGSPAVTVASNRIDIHSKSGATIHVMSYEEALRTNQVLPETEIPYLSSLMLGVRDLDRTRLALKRNAVPFGDDGKILTVDATHACGVIMFFTADV